MTEIPQTDPPLTYAAFDPGETTGWALYDEAGLCRYYGQTKLGDVGIIRFLRHLPTTLTTLIYEDYIIDPRKPQGGSNGPAMRVIGAINAFAELRGIRAIKQPVAKKAIGYKRLKEKPPGNHAQSHQHDARAHGEYWIWINNIREKYVTRSREGAD